MQYSSYLYKVNGPQHLKDNANLILVVKDTVKADNYAAHVAASIAQVAMTGTDVAFAEQGNGDVLITINAKSGIDPSGTAAAVDDIGIAYVDSVNSEVILVLDAGDRIITNEALDAIDIPAGQTYSREQTSV